LTFAIESEDFALYAYDNRNQMVAAETGKGITEYAYCGDGLRASKTFDGATVQYLYECDKIVLEKETGGGSVKYTRNVHGIILTIISADELRASGVMISKAVSWERTIMSLLWQLRNNDSVSGILESPLILVTFDSDAAVYITAAEGIIGPAVLCLAHGRSEGWLRRQVETNKKVKDKTRKQEKQALKLENLLALVTADFEKAADYDAAPDLPSMPFKYDIPMLYRHRGVESACAV